MNLYLSCVKKSHDDILLEDDVKLSIGRSPLTGITDKRCSRIQLELTAKYSEKTASVMQHGSNSSYINNKEIKKGESAVLHEKETLYLIKDNYPHCLVFHGTNESCVASKVKNKKRAIDDYFKSSADCSKKLKKASESLNDQEHEENIKNKLLFLQQTKIMAESSNKAATSSAQTLSSSRSSGWYKEDKSLLVYEAQNLKHSSKIVAFDMDGTLITTKSGKTFAVDFKDWKILFSEIRKKLKELSSEDFKLVVITNQLGIGKGKVKEFDFKKKVEDIVEAFDVPLQVLAITERGKYRKPNTGTWAWLQTRGNGDVHIDSFTYVGDAAGRPKNWAPGKKKDFSASDRLFAINLNAPFFTPEEFFLSHKPPKFELPEFDPRTLRDAPPSNDHVRFAPNVQEMVVMVGYPASGKSTYTEDELSARDYCVVSRDKLKTWQKCVAACERALAAGKSVVVDNTNPDRESRSRYIECAKKFQCPCRCFVMDVTIEHAMHNNRFRELSGLNHDVIPRMVLYSYRKKYEVPELEEGFSEIVKINFYPSFKDDDLSKSYFMFTD